MLGRRRENQGKKWGNVLSIYTLFIIKNNKTPQLQ